jgi:hypothetical protein
MVFKYILYIILLLYILGLGMTREPLLLCIITCVAKTRYFDQGCDFYASSVGTAPE